MMGIGSVLIALVLSIPILALSAPNSAQYSHRIWRIEDGLPQNRVRTITQTPDGYLWVGTSEGLARFDGVRFTVFTRSNTPALHDDGVLSMLSARDGSLWVGTEGGGLVRYRQGTFDYFGPADGLTNGFVRSIFEDNRKILWIGTDRGFFRYDGAKFTRLDNTPEIPLATVGAIVEDAAGRIWAGSSAGLLFVDNGKLMRAPGGCGQSPLRGITQTRDGSLWIIRPLGASRFQNGCSSPDRRIPNIPIRTFAEDSDGDIWIGTEGLGLLLFRDGRVTDFKASAILPDKTVNAVFEDRERNLWIGSEDGLLRLSRSHVASIGEADGLEDDNVQTVYAGSNGSLWIATLTGRIYRVAGTTVQRFHPPAPADGLQFRTAFEDRDGSMWFGTSRAGLVHLAGGKATVYNSQNGLRSNTVRALVQDSSGAVWIGLESGLSRWDGVGFRSYYLQDGLSYPSTRCIITDHKGDILVGTDSGLNRMHDGKIVPDPDFAALATEKIWAMFEDRAGTLWLGTRGNGLLRLRGGKLTRFTTANGLPSDTIYQILADKAGKFWMSTSSGIFSIDPSALETAAPQFNVLQYGTADGMITSQMNGGVQPAGVRAPSGELWFPSLKGAVGIDPLATPKHQIPPTLIERLLVDDVPVPLTGQIAIPPGHNKLEIDFTLADLVAPERLSFRYKLDGFDEQWNSASRVRSAFYTNLKPGHYTFRVRASDSSSSATASEAALAFTMSPKFYQTAWFYAAVALACALLIWMAMVLYARLTRSRYTLLMNARLAERNRLAREMHDTVIQGCVGVATLLEAIDGFRNVDTAKAESLLDDARAEITATVEEARQAVWDLRYSPAANASIAALFDLARKLGNDHHVEIDTECLGEGELTPEVDQTLLLVGREALRNAIAHARATRIGIHIHLLPSEVTLTVSDDGIGFHAGDVNRRDDRHFGMMGMRERVQKSGGSFVVESRLREGTRILVKLPRSRDSRAGFIPRLPFFTAR